MVSLQKTLPDDGFTLVNRRRKARSQSNRKKMSYSRIGMSSDPVEVGYLEYESKMSSRMKKCFEFYRKSKFSNEVAQIVTNKCPLLHRPKPSIQRKESSDEENIDSLATDFSNCSLNQFRHVVSYGIGSFSHSKESLYQLGLIIYLRTEQILKADGWLIYDPIFTDHEKRYLKHQGFEVLNENEKGAKSIESPTLFYMPHCPLPMYNNLLWANWSTVKLSQLILLGTSFNTLTNSFIADEQKREYSYLIDIVQADLVDEHKLTPPKEIFEAFNDSSIHFFGKVSTPSNAGSCLWTKKREEKPIYSDEIFSKELIVS